MKGKVKKSPSATYQAKLRGKMAEAGKRPVTVFLGPAAMEALEELRPVAGNNSKAIEAALVTAIKLWRKRKG